MVESSEPVVKQAANLYEKDKTENVSISTSENVDNNQIITFFKSPGDLVQIANAVQRLQDDITKRFEDPKCVTFMMHINLDSAKADLIPFPHKENLQKFKDHFKELPKKVQNVVTKNIPQDDMAAVQAIWEMLDSEEAKTKRPVVDQKAQSKAVQPILNKRKDLAVPYTKILEVAKKIGNKKND